MLRGRHGARRTDFGARWANPRGWIAVYDSNGSKSVHGADGRLQWFDEVSSFTEEDWTRLKALIPARP